MTKRRQYWACSLSFEYWIQLSKPNVADVVSLQGPFSQLAHAKWHIRQWIRSARIDLQNELNTCMALRPADCEVENETD